MHISAKPQIPPLSVHFFCSSDEAYLKQEVSFLLTIITVIHWIKLDYLLLNMNMIDSWGTGLSNMKTGNGEIVQFFCVLHGSRLTL